MSMTVKQLIELLQECPEDMQVRMFNDTEKEEPFVGSVEVDHERFQATIKDGDFHLKGVGKQFVFISA